MREETHQFQLSVGSLKYLKELVSRDKSLAGQFGFQEGEPGRRVTIRLSRAKVEQLRDYLTTQLAAVGFDKDYSPNQQGQLLEELIDIFFVS